MLNQTGKTGLSGYFFVFINFRPPAPLPARRVWPMARREEIYEIQSNSGGTKNYTPLFLPLISAP
jgi:hypothetical protein